MATTRAGSWLRALSFMAAHAAFAVGLISHLPDVEAGLRELARATTATGWRATTTRRNDSSPSR